MLGALRVSVWLKDINFRQAANQHRIQCDETNAFLLGVRGFLPFGEGSTERPPGGQPRPAQPNSPQQSQLVSPFHTLPHPAGAPPRPARVHRGVGVRICWIYGVWELLTALTASNGRIHSFSQKNWPEHIETYMNLCI